MVRFYHLAIFCTGALISCTSEPDAASNPAGGKGAKEPTVSMDQAKEDVGVLLSGNLGSLGGPEVAAILPRIKSNAAFYNQVIYNDFLGPRSSYSRSGLSSLCILYALKFLGESDATGSLENARAYWKPVNDSLWVYDMVRNRQELLKVLEQQEDLDDCNSIRRLIGNRGGADTVIAELQAPNKKKSK